MLPTQVDPIIFSLPSTRPCNGYRHLTLIYSNKKLKISGVSKANRRVFLTSAQPIYDKGKKELKRLSKQLRKYFPFFFFFGKVTTL